MLSLLWMAWWVRKRGRFGTEASAALRSLYPIIIGLGGFLLGTLIVLTTMPTIPGDNDLVVARSIGLPVGLGIYLAWVHHDWGSSTLITYSSGSMAPKGPSASIRTR